MRTVQPRDLGDLFAEIERRLQSLETSPTGAIALIATGAIPDTGAVVGPITRGVLPGSPTTFTLGRPRSILAISSGSYSKALHNSYTLMRLEVIDALSVVKAKSVDVLFPTVPPDGSSVGASSVYPVTLHLVTNLPAGTYKAQITADVIGADNITLASAGLGLTGADIHVFAMGG